MVYRRYSNKNLVKKYLNKNPNTKYTKIRTIEFNTFNIENPIEKQVYAIKKRIELQKNNLDRTDLCILSLVKSNEKLSLSKDVLERISQLFHHTTFIDECSLTN